MLRLSTSNITFNVSDSIAICAICYSLTRATVYIRVESDAEAKLFESQIPTIVTLTKNGQSAKVIRNVSEVPEGCGSAVVTPSIVEHMVVRVSNSLEIRAASLLV